MTSRAAITTQAVVVRLVDFGESDRIVGLFTRAAGLVSAIAKGARRSRKRFAGALQTGHLLEVDLVQGRSGMGRLEAARLIEPHLGLSTDLGRIEEASVALRAIRDHVPSALADEEIFDALTTYLHDLAGGTADLSRSLAFRLCLFDRLGVAPELDRCVVCGRLAPANRPACFDPARGGLVCRACGGASVVLAASTRELARAIREGSRAEAPPPRDAQLALSRALESFAAHHLAYRDHG